MTDYSEICPNYSIIHKSFCDKVIIIWRQLVQTVNSSRRKNKRKTNNKSGNSVRKKHNDRNYLKNGSNHYSTRRKKRSRNRPKGIIILTFLLVVCIILLVISLKSISNRGNDKSISAIASSVVGIFNKKVKEKPEIEEAFLTPNEYSRPQYKVGRIKNVFVHYTANPGTTAMQNRGYFESLGETGERSASAHFIIGYDGEIVQCMPLEEEAYAVAGRNMDSISIECCYINEDGRFTDATYQSLIKLLSWLLGKYNLKSDDILRHYDCGGKLCPLYYVNHEDEWNQLKIDVAAYIDENGTLF